MQPKATCVLDARNTIGEGAIWSVDHNALFWCDIMGGKGNGHGELHRLVPSTNEHKIWTFDEPLGCFALKSSDQVVLALSGGFANFDLSTGIKSHLCGPDVRDIAHRFNDGSVDIKGRFYAGTMEMAMRSDRENNGVLYCCEAGRSRRVQDGYYIINGMAFSPDCKTVYISDSFQSVRTIWAFDYDVDDAGWSNKRVFFDTNQVKGRPDGAAIDTDGCYWMAGIGGGQLVRITPAGKVDMIVDMPIEKPSRPAFGGPDLKTLYVTSLRDENASTGSKSGGLFSLQIPNVQGVRFPLYTD